MAQLRGHSSRWGWGGGVKFSGKKCYEDVSFYVISVTRGWVGVQYPGKKLYLTLEWPVHPEMLHYQERTRVVFFVTPSLPTERVLFLLLILRLLLKIAVRHINDVFKKRTTANDHSLPPSLPPSIGCVRRPLTTPSLSA